MGSRQARTLRERYRPHCPLPIAPRRPGRASRAEEFSVRRLRGACASYAPRSGSAASAPSRRVFHLRRRFGRAACGPHCKRGPGILPRFISRGLHPDAIRTQHRQQLLLAACDDRHSLCDLAASRLSRSSTRQSFTLNHIASRFGAAGSKRPRAEAMGALSLSFGGVG